MTIFKKLFVVLVATMAMAVAGETIPPVSEPVKISQTKNFYIGVSAVGNQEFKEGDRSWTDDSSYLGYDYGVSNGVGVQAGWVFGQDANYGAKVAFEGRYASINGNAVESTYSLFLKPSYDVAFVTVYGLAGHTTLDMSDGEKVSGFAYGAGLSTEITDSLEIFVDYVVNPDYTVHYAYPREEDEPYVSEYWKVKNDAITIGINFKF